MTEDYNITTGGKVIWGRAHFKEWVRTFQERLVEAKTVSQEIISSANGDTIVSRWICTGRNNGIFDLPPDGKPITFTGIAIWRVRNGKLAECWVERSAFEVYQILKTS